MNEKIDMPECPSVSGDEQEIKEFQDLNCWEFKKCGREPGGKCL